MTCSTCGRENPPHLTFCQECGQRLGPRIAPPTPPVGLGAQIGAQYAAGLGGTQVLPESPYAPPNPASAASALAGLGPLPSTPPTAATPSTAPAAQAGPRRCRVCETVNGPGLRYCTSCGSTLDAPPAPAPAAAPAAAPPPAYGPPPTPEVAASPRASAPAREELAPFAAPPAPLQPMRMVEAAPGAPEPAKRVCTRCRGVVDPGAAFCKFCGASLADPSAASKPPPSPAPAVARPVAPPIAPMASPAIASSAPAPSVTPAPAPVRPPTAPMPASAAPAPAPSVAPAPAPVPATAARPVAPATYGRIVVIAKSGADGPSYPLTELLDIGRAEGHIVVPEDAYLSPRHVRLAVEDKRLVLRDLASTNGVFLKLSPARDAARAPKVPARWTEALDRLARRPDGADGEIWVPLEDGDHILVGQQVLRFEVVREGDAGVGPASEHGTLLFGSPAAPRYARLQQRTVEGITRDVYYVRKVETVLGRESGDVVFTEDPFLSRRHASIRLLREDGSFVAGDARPGARESLRFALVDLGSSNGTFLRVREPVELVSGDQFRIGQQLFRVDLDGFDNARAPGRGN